MDYRAWSSFDQKWRVSEYQKDSQEELLIKKINDVLSSLNDDICESGYEPSPSILLISGPRTGSTLITQVLVSRLNLGYPSNLMARFFEAPCIGAFLQKKLIGNRIHQLRDYNSLHGVTNLVEEPHEFGYFWSRFLILPNKDVHQPSDESEYDSVNIDMLNSELIKISRVFDKPVLYKCPLGVFFLPVLNKLENVFFIFLERDDISTASSILKTRKKRFGNISLWWSLRPYNYHTLKTLLPEEQVAGQIIEIKKAIENGKSLIDESRQFTINFRHFLTEPESAIEQLCEKYKIFANKELEKAGKPVSPSKILNKVDRIESEKIKQAFLKF